MLYVRPHIVCNNDGGKIEIEGKYPSQDFEVILFRRHTEMLHRCRCCFVLFGGELTHYFLRADNTM